MMTEAKNLIIMTMTGTRVVLSSLEFKSASKISQIDTANKGIKKVVLGMLQDTAVAKGRIPSAELTDFRSVINSSIGTSVSVVADGVDMGSLLCVSGKCTLDENNFFACFEIQLEGA